MPSIPSDFIERFFAEDLVDPAGHLPTGDHTSLASILPETEHKAYAVAKAHGVLAGMDAAHQIFHHIDPALTFHAEKADGDKVVPTDILFRLQGSARSILKAERIALNIMQRMSGIATLTNQFVKRVEGTGVTVLDTRKTTPGFRFFEKWAVRIGGGQNHRMGLYDMVMLKDNHIDFCGGIEQAIDRVQAYFREKDIKIPVEIETRSLKEVERVLKHGGVNRIMLDNFTPAQAKEAIALIDGRFEVELSGGITLESIREYAECGPDFISSGALTHSYTSLDISLKALK